MDNKPKFKTGDRIIYLNDQRGTIIDTLIADGTIKYRIKFDNSNIISFFTEENRLILE